jgi:hypothetical protein
MRNRTKIVAMQQQRNPKMTVDERREFVQEIIDRLLYLPDEERWSFIDNIKSTLNEFQPRIKILDNGNTRIYKPL